MYHYHVAFISFEVTDHVGRDMILLTDKITSKNYNNLMKIAEEFLKQRWGYEVVITHFQLLED